MGKERNPNACIVANDQAVFERISLGYWFANRPIQGGGEKMSRKTLLKCDRCGKEGFKEEKFLLFAIKCGVRTVLINSNTISPLHEIWDREWCQECAERFCLLKTKEESQPEHPLPTLEEMVREIVKDELKNQ